ncbi:NOL1/NOP2/sun family protein [Zea mays]|uniref:NOL1/NOP2/sun family protein n=1 Tax=Zea mays TaxID=4577 RepID=A0A1D6PTS4_MAIZE|nr:NOL1/NOP2/sun family protein [Zea mays]
MCKFFCSLYRSMTYLIKKIASMVDLAGMNLNWFMVICVIPLRRCSITLSHSFIVWLMSLISR